MNEKVSVKAREFDKVMKEKEAQFETEKERMRLELKTKLDEKAAAETGSWMKTAEGKLWVQRMATTIRELKEENQVTMEKAIKALDRVKDLEKQNQELEKRAEKAEEMVRMKEEMEKYLEDEMV